MATMERKFAVVAGNQPDDGDEGGTGVITERRVRAKRPSLYKVLLHNDDFTPMEFVVEILESVFNKSHAEATDIMLTVHHKGVGVAGVFPYEVAETKVALVTDSARQNQHPLKCTMERE